MERAGHVARARNVYSSSDGRTEKQYGDEASLDLALGAQLAINRARPLLGLALL